MGSLPALTIKLTTRSTPKKSGSLSIRPIGGARLTATWLKRREIKTLISP
jgi:hypothetical protein